MLKSNGVQNIALEFECEDCLKQHIFHFTDSTTYFKIHCECGKILNIKPINRIHIRFEYGEKKKFTRNLRDYSFFICFKKSIFYLLKPIYEKTNFVLFETEDVITST